MKKLLFVLFAATAIISAKAQTASTTFLNKPYQVGVDKEDNLYVSSMDGLHRIKPDGTIKQLATTSYSFITVDSKGRIFLATSTRIFSMTFNNNDEAVITMIAGDKNYNGWADGKMMDAKFNSINALFTDKQDNLYVVDQAWMMFRTVSDKSDKWLREPAVPPRLDNTSYWNIIRKISNGHVTTMANGEGKYVLLMNVTGMVMDNEDNIVFNGGGFSRAMRMYNPTTGKFSNVIGKPYKREHCPVYTVGDSTKAELFCPGFLIRDPKGNLVYTDGRNHRISRVSKNVLSTVAGNNTIQPCGDNIGGRAKEEHKDGKANVALFNFPRGIAYDSKGNLFIADESNSVVRKLSVDGMVSSYTLFDRSKARINR